jgi:hypothetical protein
MVWQHAKIALLENLACLTEQQTTFHAWNAHAVGMLRTRVPLSVLCVLQGVTHLNRAVKCAVFVVKVSIKTSGAQQIVQIVQ